jgi:hypothetical protein
VFAASSDDDEQPVTARAIAAAAATRRNELLRIHFSISSYIYKWNNEDRRT